MNSKEFEIDHLLQIVESEEEAYRIARATGLNVFKKTDHIGQGTSGIFLIFEECYFEFIWLRDIVEARSNFLRFDKRCEAAKNDGSPFGIALRANLTPENESKLEMQKFAKYNPSYGAYTIYFSSESLSNPNLPSQFVMSHQNRPFNNDWHPIKSDSRQADACNFNSKIKRFESVEIRTPSVPLLRFPGVSFVEAKEHKMIISAGIKSSFSNLVEIR